LKIFTSLKSLSAGSIEEKDSCFSGLDGFLNDKKGIHGFSELGVIALQKPKNSGFQCDLSGISQEGFCMALCTAVHLSLIHI